tara:strand:- start:451 stop:621 length:171 start_codon:yes stop_codon:yes gene_type:complete
VKLHSDWIVDLYYEEMVNKKQEKNHGRYKESTYKTEETSKKDTRVSRKVQTQKHSN